MKYVLNFILILCIIGLTYWLYTSIREPIAFGTEKNKRVNAVVNKLKQIREAQEVYRGINGKYAGDWDSLSIGLRNGEISFVKLEDDPNDPDPEKFIRTETFKPAIDSIRAMGIKSLDSLKYIPFGNGETFNLQADTVTYQQTLVSVVEVSTKYNKFMGPFSDSKYRKYDDNYDPNATIKFGDLNKPSLSGNWE